MKNIRNIFGLPSFEPYTMTIKSANDTAPDPNLYYGLELEIEHANFDMATEGWVPTEDGSLRNNGVEFVSRPMRYSCIKQALTNLFDENRFNQNNYSDRTSIHVHTNCQDLTIEQLQSVLMLYQVFEGVLFNWIGHDREKNIFCVPWSQTRTTYKILSDVTNFVAMSTVERNKYTALNLVPLKSQGTIEWRHMHGHPNVEVILQWLRIIGHIYRLSRSTDHDKIKDLCVNLNTTSQYDQLMDMVFADEAGALRSHGYRMLLEEGVLNMKYSLMAPVKKVATKKSLYFAENYGMQAEMLAETLVGEEIELIAVERQRDIQAMVARFNAARTAAAPDAVNPQPVRVSTPHTWYDNTYIIRDDIAEDRATAINTTNTQEGEF